MLNKVTILNVIIMYRPSLYARPATELLCAKICSPFPIAHDDALDKLCCTICAKFASVKQRRSEQ